MQVQKGPLGDLLYPLYYRANIGSAVVPGVHAISASCMATVQRW